MQLNLNNLFVATATAALLLFVPQALGNPPPVKDEISTEPYVTSSMTFKLIKLVEAYNKGFSADPIQTPAADMDCAFANLATGVTAAALNEESFIKVFADKNKTFDLKKSLEEIIAAADDATMQPLIATLGQTFNESVGYNGKTSISFEQTDSDEIKKLIEDFLPSINGLSTIDPSITVDASTPVDTVFKGETTLVFKNVTVSPTMNNKENLVKHLEHFKTNAIPADSPDAELIAFKDAIDAFNSTPEQDIINKVIEYFVGCLKNGSFPDGSTPPPPPPPPKPETDEEKKKREEAEKKQAEQDAAAAKKKINEAEDAAKKKKEAEDAAEAEKKKKEEEAAAAKGKHENKDNEETDEDENATGNGTNSQNQQESSSTMWWWIGGISIGGIVITVSVYFGYKVTQKKKRGF